MADQIKRMFVKDGVLHIVRGRDTWSTKAEPGKEPNEWKVIHFADVGVSEEFIETFTGEFLELVDATTIFGEEREAVKAAIMTLVTEGLMPAFEQLRKIRLSITNPIPELNRRQLYENFARVLWHAYKDLFPKLVRLLAFDIGFLFQNNGNFEKGLAAFISKSPSLVIDVPDVMRRQRIKWQQGLSSFRNDFLEHRSRESGQFTAYYQPKMAEMLFDQAWRTMADLFPAFVEARFGPTLSIIEIPMNERDPKRLRRWRFCHCEPGERASFIK